MRRLIAAVAAAALLALAPPADARRAVRILTPEEGAAVAAHPHVRSIATLVSLRGRASPNRSLVVRTQCRLGPCRALTTSNRRGRWKATLHAIRARDEARMGIRVAYADTGSEGSDLVVVSLALPEWARRAADTDGELAMIGDSLAEGTAEPLRLALGGWWATTDARRSRPLADGMAVLDATPLPRAPLVLAFSLFTNDDPRNVEALDAAVRRSVSVLRPGGCAIWATIVRPKVAGVSYRAANDRLKALELELGPRLKVVDWNAAVRRNRGWIRDDGVHATPDGYRARAELYAQAARACAAAR